MKRFLRNNGLGIVALVLFLLFLGGHSLAGYRYYNDEQASHGQTEVTYAEFVRSGEFVESVFENWESEFLQMGSFVLLTVFLRQKGSPESKKLEGKETVDQNPRNTNNRDAPWPVRYGGWARAIYGNSLSIAFILLFLLSFWLHAYGGSRATCDENIAHGDTDCPSVMQYAGTSKFWYESLQNWQSEYLAVFSIVVLGIFLRQYGSPESKPINTPHHQTGSE